ncbi:2-oxoglutarate-acceptor oxidoreductase subunit OorA [Helicobacter sp. NHP19-003]|uniref:2-oxoglutarate-acceptor oxidoreductase subunit OorA n=1 Tax=Helicobacter gastrocanis TaxID=2849641 RepID=A0ABM7SIJ9_9HELI|nr:2-oxoglutarate synthase subunit alpha [Helicobacter sp. NHP19-003]BCZ17567.1 2-oxoglutarate-acceptor oxidoreductase subunit OorA [Helicobacter sp. NHP19-003]
MREVISDGNELVARAAIEAGCRFFGGYPITPSSDIMHAMSGLLPAHGGHFIQMEDEIGGICVSLGASMSGVKAMTASSGPGISLKVEQMGYAFMTETPLVIVDVMRSGPSTGMPTRVAQGDVNFLKHPTHGDFKAVALAPGSLEETYTETIRAFNLAEKLMTPVFLLLDETVGHMYGKVSLPDLQDIKIINRRVFSGDPKDYQPYGVPSDEPAILNPFFKGYRYHITGLHHGPIGFPSEDPKIGGVLIDRLFNKIDSQSAEVCLNEEIGIEGADLLVVAYGSSALAIKEVLRELKAENHPKKVGFFRPLTLWPSPKKRLEELGKQFKDILVVELNKGQYLQEVEHILGRKVSALLQANGRPFSPKQIMAKIKEF